MPYVTEENLTDIAVERWSNIPDPRLRQVMTALVRHLHEFTREIEPTPAEWFAAIQFLTRVGQKCDDLFALSDFVKGGDPAFDERVAILRRLHALPAAVEEGETKRVLGIGDGSRDGGL